jgi:hypothetical protein
VTTPNPSATKMNTKTGKYLVKYSRRSSAPAMSGDL